MATRELKVQIIGDADSLRRAFGQADHAASGFGQKMQDVGGRLMGFGAKLTLGVTAPLALLGKKAFDAASDLNESMSKVDVVFGKSAKEIHAFAKSAAKDLGMSRHQALEAAGTFGNLFKAMGLGAKPAKDMSIGMAILASDLASFNNIPVADALEKLRSGLVGEIEPLRALGVSFNAADVEAKALQLGLGGANRELTEGEKAQARYALIMDQTTLAQGDFARTADGAANKQKIANAEFNNAAATLGNTLLPIGKKIIGWLTELAAAFTSLSPTVQNAILITAGFAALLGPLTTLVGGVISTIGALGKALMFLAANPVVLIIAAIAALGVALVIAYQKSETFQHVVETVFDAISTAVRVMRDVFVDAFNWIKGHLNLVLLGLGPVGVAIRILKDNWSTAWNIMKDVVEAAVKAINAILGPLISTLKTAIGLIEKAIGLAGKVGGGVGGAIDRALPGRGLLPRFQAGGIVPGAIGSPQVVLAHGGETILPTHRRGFSPSGGGDTFHFHFPNYVGSKDDLIRMVVQGLAQRGRANLSLTSHI